MPVCLRLAAAAAAARHLETDPPIADPRVALGTGDDGGGTSSGHGHLQRLVGRLLPVLGVGHKVLKCHLDFHVHVLVVHQLIRVFVVAVTKVRLMIKSATNSTSILLKLLERHRGGHVQELVLLLRHDGTVRTVKNRAIVELVTGGIREGLVGLGH